MPVSLVPPRAVVFDLLGTIFPLEGLQDGIAALGLPPPALEAWMTAAQRDRLGLALAGEVRPFFEVMDGALDGILADHGLYEPAGARAALMESLAGLASHPDAGEALALLRREGVAVIALCKTAAEDAAPAIDAAGMGSNVVSLHDVRAARPHGEIFREIARAAGLAPHAIVMVTAYPWVVNGAAATGFRTVWLAQGRPYPATMRRPDVHARTLPAAVAALLNPAERVLAS